MMAPHLVDRIVPVVEDHENLQVIGDKDETSCVGSSMGGSIVFDGPLSGDGSNKNRSQGIEKTKSTTTLSSSCQNSIASSTSMSSFMSALLNQSANELGIANEAFKITIVQDNAKTERRGDEVQPKLVPLQRSQSKQRSMCRWTGDRNNTTNPTASSSSSNKLRRREVSDSCLSGMLKRTVRRRDSSTTDSERPKPPKSSSSYSCSNKNKKQQDSNSGRVRPSMFKSYASDSNLLMPVRTDSPRLTKNSISGRRPSSTKTKNEQKESSVLRNPALMGLDNIRVGSNGTYESTRSSSNSSIQPQILQQEQKMGILGVGPGCAGSDKQQKPIPNYGSQEMKASILNNPVALEKFRLIQQQQQQPRGVASGKMMMKQRPALAGSSSSSSSTKTTLGPTKTKDPTALPGGFQLKKIKNPKELGLKLPERQTSIENSLDFSQKY